MVLSRASLGKRWFWKITGGLFFFFLLEGYSEEGIEIGWPRYFPGLIIDCQQFLLPHYHSLCPLPHCLRTETSYLLRSCICPWAHADPYWGIVQALIPISHCKIPQNGDGDLVTFQENVALAAATYSTALGLHNTGITALGPELPLPFRKPNRPLYSYDPVFFSNKENPFFFVSAAIFFMCT